jgi:hypothetical protein
LIQWTQRSMHFSALMSHILAGLHAHFMLAFYRIAWDPMEPAVCATAPGPSFLHLLYFSAKSPELVHFMVSIDSNESLSTHSLTFGSPYHLVPYCYDHFSFALYCNETSLGWQFIGYGPIVMVTASVQIAPFLSLIMASASGGYYHPIPKLSCTMKPVYDTLLTLYKITLRETYSSASAFMQIRLFSYNG